MWPQPSVEHTFTAGTLSAASRSYLLQLAHASIAAELSGAKLDYGSPPAEVTTPRGVFTTLYVNQSLRGCVGFVSAAIPLHQAVADTAKGAAFGDPRFPALTESELAGLTVSISVLSELAEIRPEEIQIGVHGLVISAHGRRGLLLPQVAVEHAWDVPTFLEQTCRKAGLPADAWKSGARIEGFSAEVFGEEGSQS